MTRIINDGYDEHVPIDSLIPHPLNPNQGDYGAIEESINENGFYGALIVSRETRYILVGNHRWKVAKDKGETTIPVIWVIADRNEELRIMAADNQTNRLGSYSTPTLANLLLELTDTPSELKGTGFDGDDLDRFIKELAAKQSEDTDDEKGSDDKSSGKDSESGSDEQQEGKDGGEQPEPMEPIYGVLILCENEHAQDGIYQSMKASRFDCRKVTTDKDAVTIYGEAQERAEADAEIDAQEEAEHNA